MYQSTGISLYDMGMVYKEMIAESAVPGKPAERLGAVTAIPTDEREAAKQRTLAKAAALRKKREMGEANDGNLANNYPPYDGVTRGDVIAGATGNDEMGGKKKKKDKDKKLKEGLSNWRNDLREVIDGDSKESNIEIVTGLPPGKKNKIIPNPPFGSPMKEAVEGMGGELMEMVEIDDENTFKSLKKYRDYFKETATTTQTPPIDPKQTQQLANLQKIQAQKLALQKQGKLPMNASYQPEGELVGEAKADDDLSPLEKQDARNKRSGNSPFTRKILNKAGRGKSPKGLKPVETTPAMTSVRKFEMSLNQPRTSVGKRVRGEIEMNKVERGPSGRRGS